MSEGWFTWKLRISLIKMNNELIREQYVLHFNAKATNAILKGEFERLRSFLCDKWFDEHQNCKNCENHCSSLRILIRFLIFL